MTKADAALILRRIALRPVGSLSRPRKEMLLPYKEMWRVHERTVKYKKETNDDVWRDDGARG